MIVNYFGASWCGPCKKAKPFVQSKEAELKNAGHEVVFWDIDEDESEDMVERYDVSGVPTLIFVKDGELVGTMRGWNDPESKVEFEKIVSQTTEDNSESNAEGDD